MRRILTIVLSVAAFLAVENKADAQLLKNLLNKGTNTTTTNASTATTNGKAAGAALRALYTQYKADGKLDMSNLNNIANAATFTANVQGLKGQSDKGTFYKDFASGLILGSNNLVNESNSTTVMNTITNLVDNADLSASTANTSTAAEKASTAASITNILGLFK